MKNILVIVIACFLMSGCCAVKPCTEPEPQKVQIVGPYPAPVSKDISSQDVCEMSAVRAENAAKKAEETAAKVDAKANYAMGYMDSVLKQVTAISDKCLAIFNKILKK
jgi:hypothetical protein